MDNSEVMNTDILIDKLGGCGLYQILLHTAINLMVLAQWFGFNTEALATYNPGWRCLDNLTTTTTDNITRHDTNNTKSLQENPEEWTEFGRHSCYAYKSCGNVEFNSEAKTLITEYGLVCESWIPSTIISLRMAGNLVSILLVGYIGDKYGRRNAFILTMGVHTIVMNVISMFTVSWQMYAVVTFVTGLFGSFSLLGTVLGFEYVPIDWRVKINGLPTPSVCNMLVTVFAMLVKDWRPLKLTGAVLGLVFIIPLLKMPKSLRFLFVKGQKEEALNIAHTIARVNKKEVPEIDTLVESIMKQEVKDVAREKLTKSYTILDIFKRKKYRLPTICTWIISFVLDFLFYALSFGIIALPGNFYINAMISAVSELPANVISFAVANKFNRKPTLFTAFLFSYIFLYVGAALNHTTTGPLQIYSTLGFAMGAKLAILVVWIIFSTAVYELYPTVVRTTVRSYMYLFSAAGAVIAPYLIPSDPEMLYINYIILATVLLLCSLSIFLLPETKGKPLKETFDGDAPEGNNHNSEINVSFTKGSGDSLSSRHHNGVV